jgi:hypothetical protein
MGEVPDSNPSEPAALQSGGLALSHHTSSGENLTGNVTHPVSNNVVKT